MAEQNGSGGSGPNQEHPQTCKADLTHGMIFVPRIQQEHSERNHANSYGTTKRPYLYRFEIVGAVFVGIGLIVLASMQYSISFRQAKIMDQQNALVQSIQRAYITISELHAEKNG